VPTPISHTQVFAFVAPAFWSREKVSSLERGMIQVVSESICSGGRAGCGPGRTNLIVDVGDVSLDGAQAKHELRSDYLVALARGNQTDDLQFTGRQPRRVTAFVAVSA
jgi:hypothetical protein